MNMREIINLLEAAESVSTDDAKKAAAKAKYQKAKQKAAAVKASIAAWEAKEEKEKQEREARYAAYIEGRDKARVALGDIKEWDQKNGLIRLEPGGWAVPTPAQKNLVDAYITAMDSQGYAPPKWSAPNMNALAQRTPNTMPKSPSFGHNGGPALDDSPSTPEEIIAYFREDAWESFKQNMDENEHHLEDFIFDYEDETGNEIDITPAQARYRGGELNDPEFASWLKDKVAEKADELSNQIVSMINGGKIRLYRAIMAPANWTPQQPNCGIHWSWDPDQALAHFGADEDDEHFPGQKLRAYIVTADAPLSSINWGSTSYHNFSEEFGDENEITLNEDGPVTYVEVKKVSRTRVSV